VGHLRRAGEAHGTREPGTEPPWVGWTLLILEARMESCRRSGHPGGGPRGGTPRRKAAAVRMVPTLRAELGSKHGTVKRVPRSSATGRSRYGCGSARPTSTTATRCTGMHPTTWPNSVTLQRVVTADTTWNPPPCGARGFIGRSPGRGHL
jgi:hypothetical protein